MFEINEFGNKRFSRRVLDYIKQGRTDEIARLMQHYDISSEVDSEGMTLLHFSAQFGTKSMTKYLIESKVPIEARDESGQTALFWTTYANNVEQAQILLEAGADVFTNNRYGKHALCIPLGCMFYEDPEVSMVKVFIDHIENQCSGDSEEIASLLIKLDIHVSYVAFFSADVARAMLDRGFDVNLRHKCKSSFTALHNATINGDSEMIRTLLRFGANKTIDNAYYLIPFELTNRSENIEMMLLLIPDKQFLNARYLNTYKLYKMLSTSTKLFLTLIMPYFHVDLTARDKDGKIPLHSLAHNPHGDIWELFQDAELTDIDVQDRDGMTAMHHALPRVEAVRFLLDKGARLDVFDGYGRPPFFYCGGSFEDFVCFSNYTPHYTPEHFRDCIDLLLQRGLDVQCTIGDKKSLISLYFKSQVGFYYFPEYIFASFLMHLAILELAHGIPIKPLIVRHINSYNDISRLYQSSKEELEKLKTTFIVDNVTFFRLLSLNEDQIIGYARNDQIFEKITQINENPSSPAPYYIRYLRNKFLEAKPFVTLKDNAAKVIGEVMNIHYQNYVVAHTVSYLSKTDLKLFA